MSPFRRKAIENALVALLRDRTEETWTLKTARPWIAERLDGCTPAELAGAVQALRYAGKLAWDSLELSDSMRAAGPDDHDDYPGEVNDRSTGETSAQPVAPPALPNPEPVAPAVASSRPLCSAATSRKVGLHTAQTRAGSRPLPAPQHEPEIARQVREEVNEGMARRRLAKSTSTVAQPLELKKFGVADMSLAEGIQSLLAENPQDLIAAVSRKHNVLWRRVIELGRASGQRPSEALYAALERGLQQLEREQCQGAAA
jgi:hypothetical protein